MFKLFRRSVSSPVPDAERAFLDRSLLWLVSELSWEPALAPVVTPTSEFFPDDWLGTDEEIDDLMERVCRMMRVAPERVQLEIFEDGEDPIQSLVPVSEGRRSGPAGYALAAYAWVRGESDPKWQKYLAQGVLPYFRQAAQFLAESGESTLPRAPRG